MKTPSCSVRRMRAVIYTRVSSDTSGRGRSVEEQESECRAICERMGWTVAEVLVDNDISASRHGRKDRPEYRRLKEILQSGDVLVTWAASRAQRDLRAYIELRDLCAERGVQWHYSGATHDLDTGEGRFRTGLDAVIAEREADNIREAVLRAHRANAEAGLPHGQVPYGYRMVINEAGDRERVPHPEQAPIVQEIVRRVLAGESVRSIAASLNLRGVPTPGVSERWRPGLMVQMIKRPTYAGIRTHRGQRTPAVWEPLVSEDEHRRLVGILNDPTRKAHRGVEPKYLLSGIARCGVCLDPMWRMKSNGGDAYRCLDNYCTSRKMDPVDALVEEVLLRKMEKTKSIAEFEDPAVAVAISEARDLQARLDDAADAYSEGRVSLAALTRIEAKLLPQLREAERRAQTVANPLVAELIGPDARRTWDGWKRIESKRNVIRALLRVTIHPAPKGKLFRPEFVQVEWV